LAVQTKGVGAWLASSMKLDVRHDRHKPSFSFSLYVANFHVASKTQATSKMRARCSFSVQARSPSVYFRISLDGPNIGGGAMIDPTAKALRLLTVSEASSYSREKRDAQSRRFHSLLALRNGASSQLRAQNGPRSAGQRPGTSPQESILKLMR